MEDSKSDKAECTSSRDGNMPQTLTTYTFIEGMDNDNSKIASSKLSGKIPQKKDVGLYISTERGSGSKTEGTLPFGRVAPAIQGTELICDGNGDTGQTQDHDGEAVEDVTSFMSSLSLSTSRTRAEGWGTGDAKLNSGLPKSTLDLSPPHQHSEVIGRRAQGGGDGEVQKDSNGNRTTPPLTQVENTSSIQLEGNLPREPIYPTDKSGHTEQAAKYNEFVRKLKKIFAKFLRKNIIPEEPKIYMHSIAYTLGADGSYITVGRGAFGSVFLGCDAHGNTVAVKWFRKRKTNIKNKDKIGEIITEASLNQFLHNKLKICPKFLGIIEVSDECDEFYEVALVMEYCCGPGGVTGQAQPVTFHQVLKRPAEALGMYPDSSQFAQWILRITEMLQNMHKTGVFYGDLKADNVMLNEELNLLFVDFGTSKYYKQKGISEEERGYDIRLLGELFEEMDRSIYCDLDCMSRMASFCHPETDLREVRSKLASALDTKQAASGHTRDIFEKNPAENPLNQNKLVESKAKIKKKKKKKFQFDDEQEEGSLGQEEDSLKQEEGSLRQVKTRVEDQAQFLVPSVVETVTQPSHQGADVPTDSNLPNFDILGVDVPLQR